MQNGRINGLEAMSLSAASENFGFGDLAKSLAGGQ